jgi:hypothetical protein
MDNTAYLSNEGRYTIFRYGEDSLKFIAPYSLVKYEKIKEWDNGYLVVMTRYSHSQELIEEYIDLIPILKNLYMDSEVFLKPIKKVELSYDSNTNFYQR